MIDILKVMGKFSTSTTTKKYVIAFIAIMTAFVLQDVLACSNLAATSTQTIKFGTFSALTSGNVVISTSGSRSSTGGVALLGGTYQAGQIRMTGTANCTYSFSLPGATDITSGGGSLKLSNFTLSPSSSFTLNGSGYQDIDIGATLESQGSQAAGSYSGFFTIEFEYN